VITFNNGGTQARLTFQPLGGGAQVVSFNSTGNINARQLLRLAQAFDPQLRPQMVPYQALMPYGSMGYMSSYGASGSGSGGYGGSGGYYGGGGGGGSPTQTQAPVVYAMPQEPNPAANAMSALGIPNTNGQIDWPLGLRVLKMEGQKLKLAVNSEVQQVASQAAAGQADAQLLQRLARQMKQLRGLVIDSEGIVSRTAVDESRQFLDNLADALQLQAH
jgi:hypothetical protein